MPGTGNRSGHKAEALAMAPSIAADGGACGAAECVWVNKWAPNWSMVGDEKRC